MPYTRTWLALALSVAGAAQAQTVPQASGALEELIVTAQRREENIQEAPISIAAFGSETLQKMGIASVTDIDRTVPNVLLTPFPASRTAATAFIRGIGSVDVQATKDAAVGIYVDGVFLGRASGLATEVADLERVEVLRGPQGTLYGRNTTGGAINMVTTKPENALRFKQQISVGNRDYWRSQTMLNVPITDQLAARLSYVGARKNGWVKNAGSGPDFNEDKKEAGRVALRWTPTDELTVDYAYDRSHSSGGMSVYQITDAPAQTNGNPNPFYPYVNPHRLGTLSVANGGRGIDDSASGHALTLNWEVNANLALKSITAYRSLDSGSYYDYGASVNYRNRTDPPAQPIRATLPNISEVLDAGASVTQRQMTQEFQAVGDALDNRLEYIAGLFYFHERGADDQPVSTNNVIGLNAAPLGANYALLPANLRAAYDLMAPNVWWGFKAKAEAESYAAYGQATYNPPVLDDRLKLTVGLRFTRDKREAEKQAVSYDPGFVDAADYGALLSQWQQRGTRRSSRFTPAVTAAYDVADGVNLYAKYSKAYRAGGFNTRATRDTFGVGFAPEDLTAYEIGAKSDLLDNRLRLNVAAFHYDYDNQQVDQNVPPNIGATTTVNAGKTQVDGAEVDVTALLTDALQLNASYGYLHARIKEFRDRVDCRGNTVPNGGTVDVSGCRHPSASPQQSYTVALDYAFPSLGFGELSARVQYHWEDASFFTNKGVAGRGAFGLLDASLQLARVPAGPGSLRFQVWGRNLENKQYALHQIDFNSFVLTQFNEPRSFGLDATYEY